MDWDCWDRALAVSSSSEPRDFPKPRPHYRYLWSGCACAISYAREDCTDWSAENSLRLCAYYTVREHG